MKKFIFALMFALGVSINGIAQSTKSAEDAITTTVKQVAKSAEKAPSCTKYGITAKTKEHYVVSTPIGEYKIKREKGGVSFLGIWAKLDSKKNGIYNISTSLGQFSINPNKGTITKKVNSINKNH